jgi:hypothetical protein
MIVHVYSICWNEEDFLPFFFLHYDQIADDYFIFDDGSTDGTPQILGGRPNVSVERFHRSDPSSLINSQTDFQNQIWKKSRGVADWVLVTDIDEHIGLRSPGETRDYLAACKAAGVTLIPSLGFDMVSRGSPEPDVVLSKSVTRGSASGGFNKLGYFNPNAISATNFAPGRHVAVPTGNVVLPRSDELMLRHFKHVGIDRAFTRQHHEGKQLGPADIKLKMGVHWSYPREKYEAGWRKLDEAATDTADPQFDILASAQRPFWWEGYRREGTPAASLVPALKLLRFWLGRMKSRLRRYLR